MIKTPLFNIRFPSAKNSADERTETFFYSPSSPDGSTRILRGMLDDAGCRSAKVPVLQGMIGLVLGSIILTGRPHG